jgi:proline iminopeptidase
MIRGASGVISTKSFGAERECGGWYVHNRLLPLRLLSRVFPSQQGIWRYSCPAREPVVVDCRAAHFSPAQAEKNMSPTPFDQQQLPTGDGHSLYLAQYGNPDRPAAVVLHGGPGSGTQPSVLEWFDLSRQRVVLFDQRGAGKSLPQGEIANNDSQRLVADIELIRESLGIDRWMVVGGSWGATLALLYAGKYAQRISALALRGSFLASERELQWFFQSLRALVPQGWLRLTKGWDDVQKANVLATLCDALLSGDATRATDAARRWNDYENAVMNAMSGRLESTSDASAEVSARVLGKYRLQAHYLSHGCFCSEDELLRNAASLTEIPTVIVHGTHDIICPPENAMKLQAVHAGARVEWVQKGTHTPSDPLIAAALKQAIAALLKASA